MSEMTTRIGGWPLLILREEGTPYLVFFTQEATLPYSLTIFWANDDLLTALASATSEVLHWQDEYIFEHPDDEYTRRVLASRLREDSDEKREPLPQVYADSPEGNVAVWHKGRRVTSMSDYYCAVNPLTNRREFFCHVEALSVTGEQVCATANLADITYSAYRPMA